MKGGGINYVRQRSKIVKIKMVIKYRQHTYSNRGKEATAGSERGRSWHLIEEKKEGVPAKIRKNNKI